MEQEEIKCDACQKVISGAEVYRMPLKLCCKVEQIPLCQTCWQKYADKNKGNMQEVKKCAC